MAAYDYRTPGQPCTRPPVRMTESLAVEWAAFGINVNGIAPGAFTSEMMDGMLERVGDIT